MMPITVIAQALNISHLPRIENFIPAHTCRAFGFEVPYFNPHTIGWLERADLQAQTVTQPPTRIFPATKLVSVAEFRCDNPKDFLWVAAVKDINPVEARRLFEVGGRDALSLFKVCVYLADQTIASALSAAA